VTPVRTIAKNFGNALSYLFSEYKYKQNVAYRAKVVERSTLENRIELDLSPFIQQAFDVLCKVSEGADKSEVRWQDVSCAIALCTGRRMAEIHLSATFTEVDEYSVNFTGQLKGKSRKVDGVELRKAVFTIPTLVPSHLVVKGLEWLEENGKRLPSSESVEAVNRKWNRYISEQVKAKWLILPTEEMTYHKLRGAYLRAAVVNADIDPYDYLNYAREILGDDDASTIEAYQRFKIKPDSITKLG